MNLIIIPRDFAEIPPDDKGPKYTGIVTWSEVWWTREHGWVGRCDELGWVRLKCPPMETLMRMTD